NMGQFSDISFNMKDLVIWKIPRGHAGVSNAVLNVIKKLAVRRCCDGRRAKRGRTRIFAGPDGGFSASVIRMADFALRSVKIASCRDVGRISPQRIDSILCIVRNALVQQPGCNHNLDLRRFVEGARKSGNECGVESTEQSCNRDEKRRKPDEDSSSSWHVRGHRSDHRHDASLHDKRTRFLGMSPGGEIAGPRACTLASEGTLSSADEIFKAGLRRSLTNCGWHAPGKRVSFDRKQIYVFRPDEHFTMQSDFVLVAKSAAASRTPRASSGRERAGAVHGSQGPCHPPGSEAK